MRAVFDYNKKILLKLVIFKINIFNLFLLILIKILIIFLNIQYKI